MPFFFWKKKTRILVALSGGVDSAVSAHRLIRAGYDVTAAFMVQYDDPSDASGMCWRKDYRDAVRVAAHLGVPIMRWHFEKEYEQYVFDYMRRTYKSGQTPNPDVLCNVYIKFGAWLDRAKAEGFDGIATGHYAGVDRARGTLRRAKDNKKDQTYFLHQLSGDQLRFAYFPLARMKKDAVRAYARRHGIPTADKEESMGLCFVGNVPIREFLGTQIASVPGNIIHANSGHVVGQHSGAWYATVGQRHVGISGSTAPLYVLSKDMKKNEIYVTEKDDPRLTPRTVRVQPMHWISGVPKDAPFVCRVRFRHGGELVPAVMHSREGGVWDISLAEGVWAPAPGQFAVVYRGNECSGGGVIV
jgi:tRNA-uridine 2-sulfurtransferase